MINRFNLRVYGILVRNKNILLSKESYQGKSLIKFPGGGIEYGEGIIESLKREWREEVPCDIRIESLFYVTDYFIQSAFVKEDQIVSFYYTVNTDYEIENAKAEHQLAWVKADPHNAHKLTFAQDREVFRLVCEEGIS